MIHHYVHQLVANNLLFVGGQVEYSCFMRAFSLKKKPANKVNENIKDRTKTVKSWTVKLKQAEIS